jgi:hypothetical protein
LSTAGFTSNVRAVAVTACDKTISDLMAECVTLIAFALPVYFDTEHEVNWRGIAELLVDELRRSDFRELLR